jgi:6,7-dimethyl-8-ribityllumazine synthase
MAAPFRARADGHDLRVVVLRSRFNELVTQRLLDGALQALHAAGVAATQLQILEVPGSVELPLAARWLAERGGVDCIVCLGAVIRGETSHYDHVCRLAADGIQRVSLDTQVPIGFGVLTCETMEQALERSGVGAANRGHDAALVALEMAQLRRHLAMPPAER